MAHRARRPRFAARSFPILALSIVLTLFAATEPAGATGANAFLSGTVLIGARPVAHVKVTASGNNMLIKTETDSHGTFRFPPLEYGSYLVTAGTGRLRSLVRVELGASGATVRLRLSALKNIVVVTAKSQPSLTGSGSDMQLNRATLTRMPYNGSFSEMEIQMPGAARGANGVVHMNGDHGVIDYVLDGVALPQELNRDIGGEIDLNDLSFIDLIEGAYPAKYGMRFGSVFNMSTRVGRGPAGFTSSASFGSYSDARSTIAYHAPIADGGGYDIALSGEQSTRGLDPPDFASPHNNMSSVNQFAHITLPGGRNNFTSITFINSRSTFQIPNDVTYGEPASTDDNEAQADTFLSLLFHRALGNSGALTYGETLKFSNIADFGDPQNDFIYGEALNVTPTPYGNGGSSSDCADAMSEPATFGPTTCAISLADNRTAIDYITQGDYTHRFGKNVFSAGVSYDLSRVLKHYALTLQPNNFLAPILTPGAPTSATTLIDNAPNLVNTYQSYVQDRWRLGRLYQASYGVRYDFFTIRSMAYAQGFGAFSPRLKLTRFFGKRASLYAYIGRFFEPFSYENVSPSVAQELNLPLQPTQAQFDLKPERDTQLEFGGHLPLGPGSLGFRVFQKNANDLIDDTQVGVTMLHQDINYTLGRISQEALDYTQSLPRNGRAYLSVAHVISLNSGCETQLLAPCFGSPTGFTPADHEQRYSVAGGVLLAGRRGGWFSVDGEYGSGLSSAACPANTPGYCKRTPHTTFDLEKGLRIGPKAVVTFEVQNILNDRYYVTLLNAQGNHYAPPRTFSIGVRFKP